MNRTVLITGGAKGIGKAISEVFAQNHYNVVINYFSSEKAAQKLEKDLLERGFSALAICADVTKRGEIEKLIDTVHWAFGSIDVLVNNAGISQNKLFTDTTEEEWDSMINVHLKGMYNCSQMVVPEMVRKKQGKIINISSIWGMVGASCEVSYSTAKAGMIGFTKALAKELGPSNIQVNCVAPGVIETEMMDSFTEEEKGMMIEQTPLMRFGKAEEIANLVFYLAQPGADFITGQVISSNGGLVI
ncbi:MAG: 3-oxoacyl-ACP reductase [Firmicutes bacterium HGW-Firmicutes-15]|nr:MAG: 3-oxoacyl-ACP reductase [Firmicutes bacterium HGW-Firmicutes-15]